VRDNIDVVSIMNKMKENRLRWFGHVMRREEINAVRVAMKIKVKGKTRKEQKRDGWIRLRMI
jgi:hypothetical protein